MGLCAEAFSRRPSLTALCCAVGQSCALVTASEPEKAGPGTRVAWAGTPVSLVALFQPVLSPRGPRVQVCPPPRGGRVASGSVPYCLPVGSEGPETRAPVCTQSSSRSPAGLCAHLAPSGHTRPWWAGSCWACCRCCLQSPGHIHHSPGASCPECDSLGAQWPEPSRGGGGRPPPTPPPSCILTATSRQRAHFIRRQWPSRDDVSPGPGGAGGKAQGRGPRAGPGAAGS